MIPPWIGPSTVGFGTVAAPAVALSASSISAASTIARRLRFDITSRSPVVPASLPQRRPRDISTRVSSMRRSPDRHNGVCMRSTPDHEVIVVGAGFSGIGAAIKLDRAGFGDLLILEAGDGVGGAWHWNTYPGVAVDIPSFSYQFSFETRSDWSRVYAPGNELKAYAEHCVDKYGLRERIRLHTPVVAAEFDDDDHLWRLTTGDGDDITAR